jgi:hypothetical protein
MELEDMVSVSKCEEIIEELRYKNMRGREMGIIKKNIFVTDGRNRGGLLLSQSSPSPFLTCCATLPTSFGGKGPHLRR